MGSEEFVELSYEYPANPLPPKNEDYFELPVRVAEEMGLRACVCSMRTQVRWKKHEFVNGIEVHRFNDPFSLLLHTMAKRPLIAHGHSFGWIPATLAPLLAKRYVFTPHVYRLDIYPKWKVMAVLKMLQKSDAFIALTQYEKSQFSNIVDESKIYVIPHPIDYDLFFRPETCEKEKVLKKYCLKEGDRLILSIANLVPRKNFETLILGFAKVKAEFPNSKLLIVGGEPKTVLGVSTPKKVMWNYRSKLIELASSLGIKDDVIFAGHKTEHELGGFHSVADVYCLPSRTEGQLLAAGEAAASGLPLILSSLEPLKEIYAGCALFHKPMDYEQLACHIIRLLNNPKLAKTLGNIGRIKMRSYRPEIVRAKIKKLYENLLL